MNTSEPVPESARIDFEGEIGEELLRHWTSEIGEALFDPTVELAIRWLPVARRRARRVLPDRQWGDP